MLMKEISREIVSMHASHIEHTYESIGWPSDSVDWLFCHQVGKKPHTLLSTVANVSIDRAPITYDLFGNLTSATMPVNMYLNRPKPGDRLLFLGTGSGLYRATINLAGPATTILAG
jgi:3-oxoacyl-[acyl-carrier-protein] synthase III